MKKDTFANSRQKFKSSNDPWGGGGGDLDDLDDLEDDNKSKKSAGAGALANQSLLDKKKALFGGGASK